MVTSVPNSTGPAVAVSPQTAAPAATAVVSSTVDVAGTPWPLVLGAGAALAASMGVGRFVYAPILPLMHAQAGLDASGGASLATANYVGYLLGALVGIFVPVLVRSRAVLRGSLILLAVTLAAMPLSSSVATWWLLRLVAGAASALVFVIAATTLLDHFRGGLAHLVGWAFGGIGVGIALSGVLVLALRNIGDWRLAWWASAALAAIFSAAAWTMPTAAPRPAPTRHLGTGLARVGRREHGGLPSNEADLGRRHRWNRWFSALFISYSLEGVGYIIAGTFLVAAVEQSSPGGLGSGAWVLAGVAAVPSSALWARLAHRWPRPNLLAAALLLQASGIVLPALSGSASAGIVAAALFGATFLGVASLALATGAHLAVPGAVPQLTSGYSIGQIIGPLAAAPLLRHGYHDALLLAAALVLAAGIAAAFLRIGFPVASALGTDDRPIDLAESDIALISG